MFEGLASYGNYNLFASGSGCKLWTSGVEYDRHSWGRFLRADEDYVAEFLPLALLQEPTKSDYHGYPLTNQRRIVSGAGFSPIGLRLLWRPGRRVEPYLEEKGGVLVFSRKVINANATYENFSLQSSTGVLVRTGSRFDLRVGLYSDLHMSNGFMVPTNPGLDVMNANFGLSYELGRRRGPR
ncbi:MAG: acyloxyacyl hydrolase [Acidobacteriaceae bacterium]